MRYTERSYVEILQTKRSEEEVNLEQLKVCILKYY